MHGPRRTLEQGAVQPSLTLTAETEATGVGAGGTIRSLSIRWRDRDKAQHFPCQMSHEGVGGRVPVSRAKVCAPPDPPVHAEERRAEERFAARGPVGAAILAAVAVAVAAAASSAARAAGDPSEGSGLPLPRFVRLKSDHVNVRGGPNKDHDVAWVFTRPGLPVEITAEFENWRKIRDRDGSEGWVYHSLLSGKRTAYVAKTKTQGGLVPLYEQADPGSALRATLEPGVLGTVKRCNGQWCRFAGDGFDGWIEQDRLWGVYPNEKIE